MLCRPPTWASFSWSCVSCVSLALQSIWRARPCYVVAEGNPFTHNTEDESIFLTEGGRVTCLLGKLPIYWATRRPPLAPYALNRSVHIRLPPVSLSFTHPVPPFSFLCADSNDELLIRLSSVESISVAMTRAWWRSGGYRYQVLPVTGCLEQGSKPLFLLGTSLADCV